MSALATWLARWQPIAIHSAVLAGARMEAIAGHLATAFKGRSTAGTSGRRSSATSSSTANRGSPRKSTRPSYAALLLQESSPSKPRNGKAAQMPSRPGPSNRWRNFSRAGRVRTVRSSVRLHEIFSRDPLVDVLGCYGTSPPQMLRGVIVSAAAFARLRADTRVRQAMRQFVRQLLTVRLLGGARAAGLGVLGEVAVQRRAAHAGDAHQLADPGALLGCHAQGEPQQLGSVGRVIAGCRRLVPPFASGIAASHPARGSSRAGSCVAGA